MLVAQTRQQLQTTRVGTPTQKCSCTGSLLKNGGGGAQLTICCLYKNLFQNQDPAMCDSFENQTQ